MTIDYTNEKKWNLIPRYSKSSSIPASPKIIGKTIKEIWEEKACEIKSGIDLSTHNKWVCVPRYKMNDKIPPS